MESSRLPNHKGGKPVSAIVGLMQHPRVVWCVRWALGILFIVSALGKIADPGAFAGEIADYRLLPVHAVNMFAIAMPWVELLVGLSLVNAIAPRSGALLAGLMGLVFIVAVASAMARGLNIECGCISVVKSKVGWKHIGLDALLVALSAVVLMQPTGRGQPPVA